MGRGDLTYEEWARLKPHLPKSAKRGGRWASHRRVIDGVLYRLRTGVPWRDLLARFGPWKTVYERHRRWSADGNWDGMFAAVLADADVDGRIDWSMMSVDSTYCRAHQDAVGARRNRHECQERRHAPAAPPRRGAGPGGLLCGCDVGEVVERAAVSVEGGRPRLTQLQMAGRVTRAALALMRRRHEVARAAASAPL
nr:IS5 family transposase [Streptomyces sp. LUP47B]